MRIVTIDRVLKMRYALFDAPVVLAGAFLACLDRGWGISALWMHPWGWIVLAMVLGRSAGMAFNEVIDRHFDAKNPRTANRAIPAGEIRAGAVLAGGIIASLLFCMVGCCMNRAAAIAGPILVAMMIIYSYLKRVTPLCHLFLGVILACGPIMASIAICGSLAPGVVWLGVAFLASIAANDIIYGSQDVEFDLQHGLHSLPARLGIGLAWRLAALLHILALFALYKTGKVAFLGVPYFVGLVLIALYLVRHHWRLWRGSDVQNAFLWCNKVVAIGILLSLMGGMVWRVSF